MLDSYWLADSYLFIYPHIFRTEFPVSIATVALIASETAAVLDWRRQGIAGTGSADDDCSTWNIRLIIPESQLFHVEQNLFILRERNTQNLSQKRVELVQNRE